MACSKVVSKGEVRLSVSFEDEDACKALEGASEASLLTGPGVVIVVLGPRTVVEALSRGLGFATALLGVDAPNVKVKTTLAGGEEDV